MSSAVAATTMQQLNLEALDELGELLDVLLLRQYYFLFNGIFPYDQRLLPPPRSFGTRLGLTDLLLPLELR